MLFMDFGCPLLYRKGFPSYCLKSFLDKFWRIGLYLCVSVWECMCVHTIVCAHFCYKYQM